MKLYNSLSSKDEELGSNTKEITIYSCGPTVYDRVHIGNLASFIANDTLRRALIINDFKVKHAMNITDVDDKTIKRSIKEFPKSEPMSALKALGKKYEKYFIDDLRAIGYDLDAVSFIRATESIKEMQGIIDGLAKCQIAYAADDGIYFSLKKYQELGGNYGLLADISSASRSSSRIDNDEYDKESISDFALWKKQKGSEPSWPYQFGSTDMNGRPGWHIECSAMSKKLLGQPFDIHTGGVDLRFPHHENEIAQSIGCGAQDTYANIFMHNEHLLVDGKKMSKSLNNFYVLSDLTSKGYDPTAFRLLILQSHYQNQVNFTFQGLESAQSRLTNLRQMADLRFQLGDDDQSKIDYKGYTNKLKSTAADNLNTPKCLEILGAIQSDLEKNRPSKEQESELLSLLEVIDRLFGLSLLGSRDIDTELKNLIAKREEARLESDFQAADAIREQLLDSGIELKDSSSGSLWLRS